MLGSLARSTIVVGPNLFGDLSQHRTAIRLATLSSVVYASDVHLYARFFSEKKTATASAAAAHLNHVLIYLPTQTKQTNQSHW